MSPPVARRRKIGSGCRRPLPARPRRAQRIVASARALARGCHAEETPAKKKRRLSPEGRARIVAATKQRWAAKRKVEAAAKPAAAKSGLKRAAQSIAAKKSKPAVAPRKAVGLGGLRRNCQRSDGSSSTSPRSGLPPSISRSSFAHSEGRSSIGSGIFPSIASFLSFLSSGLIASVSHLCIHV